MSRNVIMVTGVLVILFGGLAWGIAGASEEPMCIPMGEITLEAPDGIEARRAAVEFPHSVHFDYACKDCHHKWTGKETIQNCTTSGCHDIAESPKKSGKKNLQKDAELKYYKTAFHKQCIGCHKQIKKQNLILEMTRATTPDKMSATGPTSCNACHPKE